ncbi:hypothetical protein [Asticcacaulis sp.]|uniref:hypothetical protein n=1 Tax=Asticcacaulis sp. TaxID=1872648 RepID=UPI002615A702|nr:hypothetical protein [Asticcacaulis sp.]
MSFKDLYDQVQSCSGKVSTKQLLQWAIHHSEICGVKEVWSEQVDHMSLRGFYVEGPLNNGPLAIPEKAALIVLSRSMCTGPEGKYWRRLVKTKELMHVFDKEDEKAHSGQTLDAQLDGFIKPSESECAQYKAENKAYWRALACLCPEHIRRELKEKFLAEKLSLDVLSVTLQIPKAHVWRYLDDDFEASIASVLED